SEMRDQVAAFLPRLSRAREQIEELTRRAELFAWVLGVDQPRKFLIVVQDSTRPRPTGGTITAYGVVTAEHGMITDIMFDDVYNLDGQLRLNVVPPAPLKKVTTAWSMHDANWFPDFPLSAQKIAMLYEAASGTRAEGVVAVSEKLFADLFSHTGISTTAHGITVNAESFSALLHGTAVERAAAIGAMPDVLRGLFAKDATRDMFAALGDAAHEKHIMAWVRDAAWEDEIVARGWDGALPQAAGADFSAFAVSDTGGGNVHAARMPVTARIAKQLDIGEDGTVMATLVVELASREAMPRMAYVRAYAPRGSVLLESSGSDGGSVSDPIDYAAARFVVDDDVAAGERNSSFDEKSGVTVFEESGKAVFGSFVTLTSGRTTRLIYLYAVPVRAASEGADKTLPSVFYAQPSLGAELTFAATPPVGATLVASGESGFSGEYRGALTRNLSFTIRYR
ncbi:MAG: DUF4012 domain-containing protein, partial [Patescibacteria group bacterium]